MKNHEIYEELCCFSEHTDVLVQLPDGTLRAIVDIEGEPGWPPILILGVVRMELSDYDE